MMYIIERLMMDTVFFASQKCMYIYPTRKGNHTFQNES